MNIKSLKDMFLNHSNSEKEDSLALTPGKKFPFSLEGYKLSDNSIVCSVSLYCMICIDLLPSLSTIKGDFLLITDGSDAENKEIIDEFNYEFPVKSIEYDLFHDYILETPFLMLIDKDGIIHKTKSAESTKDVRKFIEESW